MEKIKDAAFWNKASIYAQTQLQVGNQSYLNRRAVVTQHRMHVGVSTGP